MTLRWLSVRPRRLAAGGLGKPTFMLDSISGRYLSFEERDEIAMLRAQGAGVREIARRLGRSPSTISRELRCNAATRSEKLDYRASVAQWKSELVARRPKTAKLAANERLREYVQDRLSGEGFAGPTARRCLDPKPRLGRGVVSRIARIAGGR